MLDTFPRVRLASLPTPLEPLTRLSRALGGPELWIKRDDLTGLATGGNKARKLEFLVADAIEKGADTLITTGGPQSNHARQTAASAARMGLRAVLALTGGMPDELNGNLLLNYLFDAEVRWLGDASWDDLPARLQAIEVGEREAGYEPYVIPLGGSTPIGVLGYILAMQELVGQMEAADVLFSRIVVAGSSGGTLAGLLIGAEMFGFKGKITSISVGEPEKAARPRVTKLLSQTLSMLGRPVKVPSSRVDIVDRYLGGGYGMLGEAEREAIRMMAGYEGILVGPVYTGRALAGLLDMIRRGVFSPEERILFWHTGDTAALFAYARELHQQRAYATP